MPPPLHWAVKLYILRRSEVIYNHAITVVPAKSDIDFMFCLQSYQGLIIDRPLVY